MAASQQYIDSNTPLGATLVPGGVTFRTWAPFASEVYIAMKYASGTAATGFPKTRRTF